MALLAAACGDTAETTTTSAVPPTTEVATTTTTETQPPPVPALDDHVCYYADGVLVTPANDPLTAEQRGERVQQVPAGELELPGAIDELLNFYAIGDESDALALAIEIGPPASPVFAVGLAGHWSAAPGEPPAGFGGQVVLPAGSAQGTFSEDGELVDAPDTAVAVIDSGRIPTGDLLFDTAVGGDGESGVSGRNAGHGNFVASIILQASGGEAAVHITALDPGLAILQPRDNGARASAEELDDLRTELDVLRAIEEVIAAHQAYSFDALNLSWGAYACPQFAEAREGEMAPFPTMAAALQRWTSETSVPIVAAAGNEDLASPFWPAAFGTDCSVTAMNESSDLIVWNQGNRTVLPTNNTDHFWANAAAPGIDLVGYGASGEPVVWSGSSFAAAVVSGLVAVNGLATYCGDPMEITDYDEVSSLARP